MISNSNLIKLLGFMSGVIIAVASPLQECPGAWAIIGIAIMIFCVIKQ